MDRQRFFTENDGFFQQFGMRLLEGEEGFARIGVTVGDNALNAHGVGHGALVFALADVAFAVSVNSVTDAMGIQWSFSILRASRPGEELIAESRILHRGKRTIICELSVVNGEGKLVAQGLATALPVGGERVKS